MLKAGIRRWVHGDYKGMDTVTKTLRQSLVFKPCTVGQKCGKKISAETLCHHQADQLKQSRMKPCFHVF